MKKTFSKIKNKSSKVLEKTQDDENIPARENDAHFEKHSFSHNTTKLQVYKVNVGPTDKVETCASGLVERKAHDSSSTSTSESELEIKVKPGRRGFRKRGPKSSKKYNRTDPEVCFTVPERGRGSVHIIGDALEPVKQVEFALYDAVYGVTPVGSSHDNTDDAKDRRRNIAVYRVEDMGGGNFIKDPKATDIPSQQATPPISKLQIVHDSIMSKKKHYIEVEELVEKSFANEKVITPVVPENNQTFQEGVNCEVSEKNMTKPTQNPSLQTSKPKKHSSGIVDDIDRNEDKRYRRVEKGKEETNPSGASKQLSSIQNQNNAYRDNCLAQEVETDQSQNKQCNNESETNSDGVFESHVSNITRPLVYYTTLDSNTLSTLLRTSNPDQTRDDNNNSHSMPKIVSKASSNTNRSLKKSLSKQSSRMKPEVIGSKIAIQKSRRSLLRSSIPKPSPACSWRKSSMTIASVNSGHSPRPSKKYVIREIVVISEEKIGQHYADAAHSKPYCITIPEKTVMNYEQEIRLHDLNNGAILENGNQLTPSYFDEESDYGKAKHGSNNRYLVGNIGKHYDEKSELCSQSPLNLNLATGKPNASSMQCDNQKSLSPERQISSHGQQDNEDNDSKKASPNRYNAIFIEPETHKEIIKALDANDHPRIISLSTKLSRKDSSGKRFSIDVKRSRGTDSLKKPLSYEEAIMEEGAKNWTNDDLQTRDARTSQISSVTNKTEESNLQNRIATLEPKNKMNSANPEENMYNDNNPFGNDQRYLTYPSNVANTTPLNSGSPRALGVQKKRKKGSNKIKRTMKNFDLKESNLIQTISSFSEPVIQNDSQKYLDVDGENPLEAVNRRESGGENNDKLFMPDPMVYVGRLPNTTYNVFFAPEQTQHRFEDRDDVSKSSDGSGMKKTKNENLSPVGPKAILIFVNKKTELNRNPFDGNVMYEGDEDNASGMKKMKSNDRKKGDRDDDGSHTKHGKRKGDHGDADSKASSHQSKKGKLGKQKTKSGDRSFDVSSFKDGRGRHPEGDGVVVEKSPSGLKTVTKYPCGCMKTTKIDPNKETVSEEITSAFCRDGSKCEISQSQKDKRMFKYIDDGTSSRGRPSKYQGMPHYPQLDIVVEGLVSGKPIKSQPPAQQMKGANLTGTLTIKTNRCNGALNFYIDPRLKTYLRDNLACITR